MKHFIPQITKVTELNTEMFNIVIIKERINAKFVKRFLKIQFGNEGTKMENEKDLHLNGETIQRGQMVFQTYFTEGRLDAGMHFNNSSHMQNILDEVLRD